MRKCSIIDVRSFTAHCIYLEQCCTVTRNIGIAPDYIRNYIRLMLVAVRFDRPHWSLRFKPIVLHIYNYENSLRSTW